MELDLSNPHVHPVPSAALSLRRVREQGQQKRHLHGLLLVSSLPPQVADMLLELCVTELEDVATDSQSGRLSSQPVVVESSHPYTDDTSSSGTVKIPGTRGPTGGVWRSQCHSGDAGYSGLSPGDGTGVSATQ